MSVVLRSASFCVRTIQPDSSSLDRISLAEPGWIPKRFVKSLWVIASNPFSMIRIRFWLAFPSYSKRMV